MAKLALVALAATLYSTAALVPASSVVARTRRPRDTRRWNDEDFGAPEVMTPTKGRLGSSVDQDGKSNIWAVEPKMQVGDEAGAGSAVAVAVGAVLALGLIAGAFLFINVEQ
mmetsp:Transcript_165/g.437  ORF Transcript_165/g.437 Transcript_165/m.437 type:complete len:112 (-) Transcript_165:74-409(-)